MALDTLVNFLIINAMGMVNDIIKMTVHIQVVGRRIKNGVKEFINARIVLYMKANLKMESKSVMGKE